MKDLSIIRKEKKGGHNIEMVKGIWDFSNIRVYRYSMSKYPDQESVSSKIEFLFIGPVLGESHHIFPS